MTNELNYASLEASKKKVNCYSKSCTWKENDDGNWATKCGNLFVINYGTPRENKMKFCCFCGNKLRQVEYREK